MPEMALQLPFLTAMNRLSTVCLALYAHLMDILEDEELGRIIDERANERVIEVNIDDL